jgi:DNA-binding XRE family transcriptional regulator
MADRIGVPRIKYARIENGTAAGKLEFWETLQKAFGIPNEEMWALTIKE